MPDIKETKNTFFSKFILFNQNNKTSKKKSNFSFTFLHVDRSHCEPVPPELYVSTYLMSPVQISYVWGITVKITYLKKGTDKKTTTKNCWKTSFCWQLSWCCFLHIQFKCLTKKTQKKTKLKWLSFWYST